MFWGVKHKPFINNAAMSCFVVSMVFTGLASQPQFRYTIKPSFPADSGELNAI
jgi:hypothetical protein